MESDSWYKDNFLDSEYETSDTEEVNTVVRRNRYIVQINAMATNNARFTPSLGPSRGNVVINYETSDGLKTYKRATEALKDEYDGKASGLAVFRMQLLARAKAKGWMNSSDADIINIPKDGLDKANGTINIIKEHAQISNRTIRLWAANKLVGKTSVERCDQNNENMGLCITASLSKDHLAAMYLKDASYRVDGIIIASLLFKVIMDGVKLDTMVTSAIICQELQELDVKILELNSNVTDFVKAVNGNIKKLESRGEAAMEGDLIMITFKALKVVKDKCFREHFTTFEYDWLSGRRPMTSESLLNEAETYYKVKVQKKSWGALSKEEEELIVMKAVFKDFNLRLDSKKKKRSNRRQPKENDDCEGNFKSKKTPKWKLENKKGDKKMKKEGKTYYWCKWHNKDKGEWVLHHPSNCKNCPESAQSDSNEQTQEQAMPAIEEEDKLVAAILISSKESEE